MKAAEQMLPPENLIPSKFLIKDKDLHANIRTMAVKRKTQSTSTNARISCKIDKKAKLGLGEQPNIEHKIPLTLQELLTEYAFSNGVISEDQRRSEFQADYWTKPDSSGRMVLFAAKAALKYNITECDPFLKSNLLNNISCWPTISTELTTSIQKKSIKIMSKKSGGLNQWSSTGPNNAENLHARQEEADQMFKILNENCIRNGKEGNFLGYAATSIALAAWCSPKQVDVDKTTIKVLMTMVPKLNFSNDRLFKRTAKKRLLDKSEVLQYKKLSKLLNYTYNIGICSSVFVAWTGWYLICCSENSDLPLSRAIRIGAIESLGMTNWVTLEEMFTLPTIRPIALDMVRSMGHIEWRSDPACVAGVWSGIYQNMKRRDVTSGKWPSDGCYNSWTYSAVQPVENVALSASTVLVESGVDPDLLFRINKVWRMYNDLLDINTDAATGEVNNHLSSLLLTHLEKETPRTKLADVCIAYHNDLMNMLEDVIAESETRCGYNARAMTRCCALWYMWLGRYNTWHKYLLGLKSRVLEDKQKLTIRWEMVDPAHMAQVFKAAGCSCANTEYLDFRKSCIPSNREENNGFTKLYTAMVSAIIGMTACHNKGSCNCAELLAEYMDAELGGEYCGHVMETLHLPEIEKLRFADILMELVDSREYNIFRFVGAGCGYFFKELCENITGSLFHHCSLD